MIFIGKISKGAYYRKNVGGVRFFFSAPHLMEVYTCTKFHENTLDGIKVKKQTQFS